MADAYIQNLTAARDRAAAELARIMACPQPDYSIGGVSMSYQAYYASLLKVIDDSNSLIAKVPFCIGTRVVTRGGGW